MTKYEHMVELIREAHSYYQKIDAIEDVAYAILGSTRYHPENIDRHEAIFDAINNSSPQSSPTDVVDQLFDMLGLDRDG